MTGAVHVHYRVEEQETDDAELSDEADTGAFAFLAQKDASEELFTQYVEQERESWDVFCPGFTEKFMRNIVPRILSGIIFPPQLRNEFTEKELVRMCSTAEILARDGLLSHIHGLGYAVNTEKAIATKLCAVPHAFAERKLSQGQKPEQGVSGRYRACAAIAFQEVRRRILYRKPNQEIGPRGDSQWFAYTDPTLHTMLNTDAVPQVPGK
ncbi:unnamed protein product [Gongylonema pulchrum]|uniref:Retrotransposon hot spot (RHS) protein n=1 Tax=Gongylonema pulchrum TaxID=637853 RepID=A0A183DZ33_9BILA|nr:unnamed protein product [Gongylonema pulchrum]